MSTRILVIEDDKDIVALLKKTLEAEYEVLISVDGVAGMQLLEKEQPDLVLLDLMLPQLDGWEVLRLIRQDLDVPVIVLSALGREKEIIRGLELGADDYISKPFSVGELRARVRAALRRARCPLPEEQVEKIDERLALDRARYALVVNGKDVDLSSIEYKLLNCFVDNVGRVLTHRSLLTQVWGWEYLDETDYLKVYVHRLRKKIEVTPAKPRYILTERGVGYRFQIP